MQTGSASPLYLLFLLFCVVVLYCALAVFAPEWLAWVENFISGLADGVASFQ